MSKHSTHDVLVVGAGPAGLTTAVALARHGIDVLVVERHAGTSPFPKATGVSTRTMEVLRSWGLDQQARAGGMRVRPVISVSDTLIGPEHAAESFNYPTAEQALAVSPTTPAYLPQDHLEPVLLGHLVERGGTVRFHTEVTDLQISSSGAAAGPPHRPAFPGRRALPGRRRRPAQYGAGRTRHRQRGIRDDRRLRCGDLPLRAGRAAAPGARPGSARS